MKRVFKYIMYYLTILSIIVSSLAFNPIMVYAGDFASDLSTYLGRTANDDDIHNFSLIITTLKTDGLSDEGIAGILGNVAVEGGAGSIFAIEGYSGKTCISGEKYTEFELGNSYDYGTTKPSLYTNKDNKTMGGEGHGICQWSFGRATGLSDFAASHTEFKHVTVKHWVKDYDSGWFQGTYNIPDIAGQVLWMLEEMNTSYTSTKSAMVSATNARDAAKSFHDSYEGSSGYTDDRADYAELALVAVKSCTGVVGGDGKDAANIGNGAVNSGIWTEEKLSAFVKLNEVDLTPLLDDAVRGKLTQSDVENLANWERNINNNTSDSGAIHYLRIFVMFMGIILIVWSVFIYLSYWFDRVNNFIDIDLLGILTFNKLHISDTEEECTFHLKTLGKTDKKTVNHRAVCIVCITGICFGTLIVSGVLYKLLNSFINIVLRILGGF